MAYRFLPPIINGCYCLRNNDDRKPLDRPFYFVEPWKGQEPGMYISLTDNLHGWFLDNDISYELTYLTDFESYYSIGYRIDIEDKNDAMIYKLVWG